MHAVDGKVSSSPGRARASAGAWRCTSARAARAIVVAEWKDAPAGARRAPSSTSSASRTSVSCATSSSSDQIDAMVAQTVERFGRVDGLDQQRADVPAARADRRRERRRRRRVLHVGREGHAVGDAGRVPAHEGAGVGSHRQLRVVDGHHRRHADSPRTTRRRKRSARSRAPRRASGRATASS